MRDLAYADMLLDEIIDRYGLAIELTAIGNVEVKMVQVLQALAQSGSDTKVGVRQ